MKLLIPAVLILALAACSQSSQPEPPAETLESAAAPASAPAAPTATPSAATDTKAQLASHHWLLTAATDASGQRMDVLFVRPDKPLQLDFSDKGLAISNTCNRMHGPFTVKQGTLHIGNLASTLKACSGHLMAMGQAVQMLLHGDLALSLDSGADTPSLTLTTEDGTQLVFEGELTAAARYGSPGETVFLEVAPQTVACIDAEPEANAEDKPAAEQPQCLKIRQVHYNDKGIRTEQIGEWHPLAWDIKGYSHKQGVRNVLRVKRFNITNASADGPKRAYVLDLVVESEIVK